MGNQVIPFESNLPAHLAALGDVSTDDLISGASGGFPVVSIKGKVFHIIRGDEHTLVTKPDSEDGEPASSIEVVILKANKALSKTYYTDGYVEGAAEKPTCYSNDGVTPAADAQEPQAQKCATCPHNVWGSKISENGSKVKACSDFRRLAIAPIGQLNDPMLLRVPAASLKTLMHYGDALKKRGVKYPLVSTKIGFDYTVAYPALTFKPVGFLSEEMVAKVAEMINSDLVAQIVGIQSGAPAPAAAPAPVPAPAPKPTAAAPTPAPAPAPAPAAPKAAAKPAAAKKTAAAAAKPPVAEVTMENLEEELDRVLAAAGFDDAAK